MFYKVILRFMIAAAIAIPFIFLGNIMLGPADVAAQEPLVSECVDCHEITQKHWSASAHANSVTSSTFQDAWNEQGQPRMCFSCHTTNFDDSSGNWDVASVSCSTCHNPAPGNHPEEIMPTDVSSRLCGNCHVETYSEWTESIHAQEELACVRCHSPHTTSIRTEDSQALCSACHSDQVHFYSYTPHYEEGLLCIDCHVRVSETLIGEGHGKREHTFMVDTSVCGDCHREDLHFPSMDGGGSVDTGSGTTIGDPMITTLSAPDPVSPLGFSLVAILVGAALGFILAPWSERWFRRVKS